MIIDRTVTLLHAILGRARTVSLSIFAPPRSAPRARCVQSRITTFKSCEEAHDRCDMGNYWKKIIGRRYALLIIIFLVSSMIVLETVNLSHFSVDTSVLVIIRFLANDTEQFISINQDYDNVKRPENGAMRTPTRAEVIGSFPPHPVPRQASLRGFLLPLSVDQQLTGGLKGFTQLATLAAIFNLSTVEPYVQRSRLVGVPRLSEGRAPGTMRLSDLYDWEDLRRLFKTCSTRDDHQLSSFETFLENASREVILVHMVTTAADFSFFFAGRNEKIIEVGHDESLLSGVQLLNEWATKVFNQVGTLFRTARIILVDARPMQVLPLSVIVKDLGSFIDKQVSQSRSATVLFGGWRAISFRAPLSPIFYYVPGFFWRPCQNINLIKRSERVIHSSLLFSQSLNDSDTGIIVGVHIRGERLLRDYKGSVSDCLEELESHLESYPPEVRIRIVHDLGEYGTSSCTGICSLRRNSFLSQVKKLGYPIVSFNSSEFSSVPISSGYAALVEGEYLSKVDVLLTVGWGGFQNAIVQRFMLQRGGKGENLHRICNSPSPSYFKRRAENHNGVTHEGPFIPP